MVWGPHPDSTPFVYLDGHVLAIANDTPAEELAPLGSIGGDGVGDDGVGDDGVGDDAS